MKYIKLTAKPDTWYKAGSEVFWEGNPANGWTACRPTTEQWDMILIEGGFHGIGCRGIYVCDDSPRDQSIGRVPGEEIEDGEWCLLEEFNVEIVDEPKTL